MTTKIEKCCDLLLSFKNMQWNAITILVCGSAVCLSCCVLVSIILINSEETGSVVSNSPECAVVGKGALTDGGSVVDAAIATLLCEGVTQPNGAGIGGGFVALIYSGGRFDSIVATPTVPAAFAGTKKFNMSFRQGPKSIGVPGELKGYWEMHQKYGILPWKRLFEPSIKLCLRGVKISRWLAGLMEQKEMRLGNSGAANQYFGSVLNAPRLHNQGTKIKRIYLANTLIKLANKGPAHFYEGELGDGFVQDIQDHGGVITKNDLMNYSVLWNDDLPHVQIKSYFKVVTMPLPTSGAMIALTLNVVKNLKVNSSDAPLFWHKYVEAYKYALGQAARLGDDVNDYKNAAIIRKAYRKLIDPEYARQIRYLIKNREVYKRQKHYGSQVQIRGESGSSNICIVAPNGDAIVATTSLGSQFGSSFISRSTGVVINNLMMRYVNVRMGKIKKLPIYQPIPGSHPFIMHSPAIAIRRASSYPYFVVGASGGAIATTLIATAIVKYILNQSSAAEAADLRYLNFRPFPGRVEYELMDLPVYEFLHRNRHRLTQVTRSFNNFSSVTCIGYRKTPPAIVYDIARGGSSAFVDPSSPFHQIIIFLIGGLSGAIIFITLYRMLGLGLPK